MLSEKEAQDIEREWERQHPNAPTSLPEAVVDWVLDTNHEKGQYGQDVLNKDHKGLGGAPTRATTLAKDAAGRKRQPVASGVLDYFPDALVAVAEVSYAGNEQHNPGQPLHWAREKSTDQSDTIIRHFLQRGQKDKDGQRHSAKMAWRALALLQLEIEAEKRDDYYGAHTVPGVTRS